MKQLSLAMMLFAGSLTGLSATGAYKALEFKTVSGQTYNISAEGLTILPDGGILNISNSENEVLSLNASDLVSMEFVDYTNSVEEISATIDGPVTAYTVQGVSVGKFKSSADAWDTLPAGFYLLKGESESGPTTLKVRISK